jgi:hypothetical protein
VLPAQTASGPETLQEGLVIVISLLHEVSQPLTVALSVMVHRAVVPAGTAPVNCTFTLAPVLEPLIVQGPVVVQLCVAVPVGGAGKV